MSQELTDANFAEIIDKSGKPALVDFWASWCGPCRMLSSTIDELSTEYPDVVVGKVNVDENPELSIKYKVRSIPTLLFIKGNGEVSEIVVGARPKSELIRKLDDLIKNDAK